MLRLVCIDVDVSWCRCVWADVIWADVDVHWYWWELMLMCVDIGASWCDVSWSWFEFMWCALIMTWVDVMWAYVDVSWCDMSWYDMIFTQYDIDVIWVDMSWYTLTWHDMIWVHISPTHLQIIPRVSHIQTIQSLPQLQNLFRLNLNITSHSLGSPTWLMHHNSRVW